MRQQYRHRAAGFAIMQQAARKKPQRENNTVNRSGKLGIPLPPNVQVTAADTIIGAAMKAIADPY